MAKITLWGLNEASKFYNGHTLFDSMALPSSEYIANTDMLTGTVNAIMVDAAEFGALYQDPGLMKQQIDMWSNTMLPIWQRFVNAIDLTYDPIENYNRMESWTDSSSGEKTDSGTNSGSSSSTNAGSISEKDVGFNTESGEESSTDTGTISKDRIENSVGDSQLDKTITDSGEPTSEESVSAYNATGFAPNKKIENVTDNENVTDESIKTHSSTGISDIDTHNLQLGKSTNTKGTSENIHDQESSNVQSTTQSATSNNDSVYNDTANHSGHVHGNIGVTTSQKMLLEEFEIARYASVFKYIADDFIRQFCIMVY